MTAGAQGNAAAPGMSGGMKILIVDDDPLQRKLLRTVLSAAGHRPVEACDGVEALDVLRSGKIDAVITDVLMPRLDGYRLCYEIRKSERLRHTPVLVYTASFTSTSEERLALASGADEFLPKPASVEAIFDALRRVVATDRPRRAPNPPDAELEILKLYSQGLVRKLDEKNRDLEAARVRLAATNDELRASDRQARLLLDSTAEGIYGIDLDGRITFSNAAGAKLLGFEEAGALVGKNAHAWVHQTRADGTARARETCGICRTIVDGRGHSSANGAMWRLDGTSFSAEYRSHPLLQEGRRVGAVVTFSDNEERKRAEDTLRESEERFSLVFHASPIATSITEAGTSRIIDVNQQFLAVLGYTREEVIGRTAAELRLWYDAGERSRIVGEVLASQPVRDRRGKLRTKSGDVRDIRGSIVRIDLRGVPCILSTFVDVTDRRSVEKALRSSQQRNRALMEQAKDAIIVLSLDGIVLEINRAAEELVGRTHDDVSGTPVHEMVPEGEREAVAKSFTQTIADGSVQGFSTRILRSDGTSRPIEVSASVVDLGDSKVVLAIIHDVTRRHLAQEDLRSSEERHRLLFDASPQPLWVFDSETLRYLAVNDAACRNYGYSREEFLTLTVLDIRTGEGMQKLTRDLAQADADYRGMLRHRKKDGSIFDVEISSHRLVFQGRPAQMVLSLDVTSRVAAEDALRKSEARYRMLFEHNLAGVSVSTPDGRILDCNDALVRIYGYASREEVLTRRASDLYPDPDERSRFVARLLRDKTLLNHERKGKRKDGSDVWLLCNYTLETGPDKAPVIQGTLVDVTEKRRLEDQLRQSQKMEAIGQLAGGIAHDFNNILTTILGYGSIALERIDPKDPLYEDVSEIQRGGERAAELTRKLLAFSRKQILEPRVIDLNATVSGMEGMVRRLIGENIRLVARAGVKLGCVRADPGQMEQALLNLAVNSRDAMPRGGSLTIETANVRLDAEYAGGHAGLPPSGDFVMLAVSDTGCGIDPATRARIFEPFFTTKEQGKGTGLGLSTVYGIVKQSDGFIWCYSEPGVGTTFKIYLPQVVEQPEPLPAPRRFEEPRGSETILLVEDEEALARLARRVLEKQGYRLLEARSGLAAIEIARANSGIDLLLTDVIMPGMSGGELAAQLQSERPDLKVLFMSGYTDDAVVHHGILAQDAAFLQKPFTPATLARKVREVLAPSALSAAADDPLKVPAP